MNSLRARLSIGMLAGIALLLALFGLVVYESIHSALMDEFDTALEATARTLAASVEIDADEVEIEFDAEKLPEFRSQANSAYFQFWYDDGTVVSRSPSLGKGDLIRFSAEIGEPEFRPLPLPHGAPGRAVGLHFFPRREQSGEHENENEENEKEEMEKGQASVTLVLAKDTGDLDRKLSFLRWLLIGAGLTTMAMAFLLTFLTVNRGLKPLKSIAAQIAALKENKLTDEIPDSNLPQEIKPVVQKLNDLLSRLDAAFIRERAFTADAAHELRTPLAGILSTMEVSLSRNRDGEDYKEALEDCLNISKEMQSMVESLLLLARLDAGQIKIRCEPVQLTELTAASWGHYEERVRSKGLNFVSLLPDDFECFSSRELLSMALSNLFSNAVEYTNKGGEVCVAGKRNAGLVEIKISNTGCRISADEVPLVFKRFWRGDASRSGTGMHYGLGLSLVKRSMNALGGKAEVSIEKGEIFCVTLTLAASCAPI